MALATQNFGRIIMFDGPDGVGKTEQVRLVEQALREQQYDVYVTRIHGGTPIGEKLREVSLSDTPRTPYTDLYISKAIHAEFAYDLRQRRTAGTICLVDRSPAAMWAYQVKAGGLDPNLALPIIKDSFAMFNADAVLVYEAGLHILKERLALRSDSKRDYFENRADAYHEYVIIGYAETERLFGTTLVSAHESIEAVHAQTMGIIQPLLPAHAQ
ncbi:MAG TPA: hypothetical protein VK983_00055 [Candidatus Limnocylindrales bacterium]|nr:hypothetical protein [Candidatus Limnocylindrales bacterium]